MKVLVIGSVYPRFAADAEVPWLRTSIAHLKKAGVQVQVLAPSYKGLKSHEIDGVKVNRFRYAPASLEMLTHEEGAPSKMASKPWLQLLAIPYIISGFFRCIALCKKFKPDVIHVHWPFPHAYIALGAAKLFHIPLALNFHGAELLLIRKKKWVRPLLKFAIGKAQAVFANSSFTAKKIKDIRSVNVEWSPYGTTLETFSKNIKGGSLPLATAGENQNIKVETPSSATPSSGGTPQRPNAINAITEAAHPTKNISKQKFKILFVGRHIERKGIHYLIESAKYLPADSFEIRIVGVGDLTQKLKAEAEILNNANEAAAKIIFTGKLSSKNLAEEYKTANVFVLPAIVDSKGDTEGLGVVLIEAMELNLPIVASNVGGIPDVVVDNESGILVPEKNPQALADAFKKLAANPSLIQKLLQGSRKRINECFSWDGIINRQIEVYKKISQAKF